MSRTAVGGGVAARRGRKKGEEKRGGTEATGKVGKDRKAVAPLFFMWKSYSCGIYDQLPGCFHSRVY